MCVILPILSLADISIVLPLAALYCLLLTSPLYFDFYWMNLDYNLSMCGFCQYIARPPTPLIVFAPLVINLHLPTLGSHPNEA